MRNPQSGHIYLMVAKLTYSSLKTRIVVGLVAVNIGIELILLAADYGIWGNRHWRQIAYQNGAFWAGLLHNWRPNYPAQPWTMFFTYALLHGGPLHLIGNMVTLWVLAPTVLMRVGLSGFGAIYALSTLSGAIGFGILTVSPSPMVGASGALFGLVGALLFWRWSDDRQRGTGHWPTVKTVVGLALLNLILWLAMGKVLAWETHLGGFIAGWLVAAMIEWRRKAINQTP